MNNVAEAIIQAAKLLGNNNANTEMGALEAHGLMVKESGELISASLDACSCAFGHGLPAFENCRCNERSKYSQARRR